MHQIFVFGTLKENFPNWSVNNGQRVDGRYQTVQSLALYLIGERYTPWMLEQPGQGEPVTGEVYRVDDAALDQMDELERINYPDGYQRKEIDVRNTVDGSILKAFVYLKALSQLDPNEIKLGPLAEYTLEHGALYRPRQT